MQTDMQGMANAMGLLVNQQAALVSKLDNFTEAVTSVVRDVGSGRQSRGSRRAANGNDADDEDEEPVPLPMRSRKKFRLTGQRKQRTAEENALHVSIVLANV